MDKTQIQTELKENFKFFDLNRNAIIAGHHGEEVVIRNRAVVGYAKDRESAYNLLPENTEPGSFIIQECLTAEEDTDDIGCHIPTPAFEVDWR